MRDLLVKGHDTEKSLTKNIEIKKNKNYRAKMMELHDVMIVAI